LHSATYTRSGIRFRPRATALDWSWRLRHFGTDETNFMVSQDHKTPPTAEAARTVAFDHGSFVEQYIAGVENIEQQFVLREKPALPAGEDLVIRGKIESPGAFESSERRGWLWRDSETNKVVSLGNVHVFDAEGATIPASMQVTSTGTEITVERDALLTANFPVIVDPEIGTNDFFLGGATLVDLERNNILPAVAYNQTVDEFLVVWGRSLAGDIWGQRIAATTGRPVGFRFQINVQAHCIM
jgi:hypothetical protein